MNVVKDVDAVGEVGQRPQDVPGRSRRARSERSRGRGASERGRSSRGSTSTPTNSALRLLGRRAGRAGCPGRSRSRAQSRRGTAHGASASRTSSSRRRPRWPLAGLLVLRVARARSASSASLVPFRHELERRVDAEARQRSLRTSGRSTRAARGPRPRHAGSPRRARRRSALAATAPLSPSADELDSAVLRAGDDDARRAARGGLDYDESVALALGGGREARSPCRAPRRPRPRAGARRRARRPRGSSSSTSASTSAALRSVAVDLEPQRGHCSRARSNAQHELANALLAHMASRVDDEIRIDFALAGSASRALHRCPGRTIGSPPKPSATSRRAFMRDMQYARWRTRMHAR